MPLKVCAIEDEIDQTNKSKSKLTDSFLRRPLSNNGDVNRKGTDTNVSASRKVGSC